MARKDSRIISAIQRTLLHTINISGVKNILPTSIEVVYLPDIEVKTKLSSTVMMQKIPFPSLNTWTKIFLCTALLVLGLSWSNALAQEVRVSISNTTAKQGEHLAMEVSGTITDAPLDSIRLVIDYNANRLIIDSVRGGPGFALGCLQPTITNQVSIQDGRLEVVCANVSQVTDGKLFIIYCTVLAGLGTAAEISPKECFINGLKKTGALTSGTITIDDIPISVKFIEKLGLPFENPSYTTIRIPYTIDAPTKVTFTLYDLTGRVVEEISGIERTQGYYEFDYIPKDGVFANGAYFVKMTTESSAYFTFFMRLR